MSGRFGNTIPMAVVEMPNDRAQLLALAHCTGVVSTSSAEGKSSSPVPSPVTHTADGQA